MVVLVLLIGFGAVSIAGSVLLDAIDAWRTARRSLTRASPRRPRRLREGLLGVRERLFRVPERRRGVLGRRAGFRAAALGVRGRLCGVVRRTTIGLREAQPGLRSAVLAVRSRVLASLRARRRTAVAVVAAALLVGVVARLGVVPWGPSSSADPPPWAASSHRRTLPGGTLPDALVPVTAAEPPPRGAPTVPAASPGSDPARTPGTSPGARPRSRSPGAGASSRLECPLYLAYRGAMVASHLVGLAPVGADAAERKDYAVALERLRATLPSMQAEIDVWDRVERTWVDRSRERPWPPSLIDEVFDDPAFVDAIDHIQAAIDRGCAAPGP